MVASSERDAMDAFRIKNLRCLTDTQKVPIRPITVLVGRNSSGKSTFLRTFPLLRQSVETATDSPILWYHDSFVDFGSLADAAHTASDGSVTLEFWLELAAEFHREQLPVQFAITLARHDERHGGYVKSYLITVAGHTVQLEFDTSGKVIAFLVNKRDVLPKDRTLALRGPAFLLPRVCEGEPERVAYQSFQAPFRILLSNAHTFLPMLRDAARVLFHGNTSDDKLTDFVGGLPVATPERLLGLIQAYQGGNKFQKQARALSTASHRFRKLADYIVAEAMEELLSSIDRNIARFAARVAYLAPLRASADRSYRIQELAVGDVDPRGKNLPMFLRSLSDEEKGGLAEFTRTYLDFESLTKVEGLHAEIRIREAPKGPFYNLVDVGSGYSQVLPLAAMLWLNCIRNTTGRGRRASLVALEQPELHLHPAHQAKLARMFAGAVKESRKAGGETKLLVETHSEAIVNGLGELIADGEVTPGDVQIVLFDQDERTRETSIRLAHFDEEGALQNWPYGFFAPVEDRREAAE